MELLRPQLVGSSDVIPVAGLRSITPKFYRYMHINTPSSLRKLENPTSSFRRAWGVFGRQPVASSPRGFTFSSAAINHGPPSDLDSLPSTVRRAT